MRILRLLTFIVLTGAAALFCLGLRFFFSENTRQHIATAMLTRWSRLVLRLFGFTISERGNDPYEPRPTNHLIVANHISYLDIPILLARGPCIFLGKHELATWPLIGLIAKSAGIIFVDRSSLWSRASAMLHLQNKLQGGFSVVIFPEGSTSLTGPLRGVTSFYRGAFRLARMEEKSIESVYLDYEDEDRCAWLGEAAFAPHLWRLLAQPGGRVRIRSHWTQHVPDRVASRRAAASAFAWLSEGGRSLTFF